MAGRPTPAGPRNLRELFHYIYKWTTSIYDETAPAVSSAHPAVTVTDTATIDLSVSGSQVLSASVVPDSIGYTQLDATVEADIAAAINVGRFAGSQWTYRGTSADADPGAGNFKTNNATLSSVTEIYLDDENNSGVDVSSIIALMVAGGRLYIQQSDDATKSALFSLTTITDNPTYYKLVVVHIDSGTGGSLINNENAILLYSGGSASSGHIIKEAGAALPAEVGLNFDGTDFDIADSAPNTNVALSSASRNATHTGEVTGATALTVQPSAITNRSVIAVDRAADYVIFYDASGAVLGKALASTWDLVNDTTPELSGTLECNNHPITEVEYILIDGQVANYVASIPHDFIELSANHTYDFASVIIPGVVSLFGTHTLKQSAFSLGMGTLFNAIPTIKNDSTVTANFKSFYTLAAQPALKADSKTIALTSQIDITSNTSFSTTGASPALNVTSWNGFQTGGSIGAAVAMTAHICFYGSGPSVSGGPTFTGQAAFASNVTTATSNTDFLGGTNTIPTGNFHVYQSNTRVNRWNGGQRWKTTIISASSATLTDADHHVFVTYTAGACAIAVPTPVSVAGLEFVIKKTGSGGSAVMTPAAGTFDGAGTLTLNNQYDVCRFVSDGTNYPVIKQAGAP